MISALPSDCQSAFLTASPDCLRAEWPVVRELKSFQQSAKRHNCDQILRKIHLFSYNERNVSVKLIMLLISLYTLIVIFSVFLNMSPIKVFHVPCFPEYASRRLFISGT